MQERKYKRRKNRWFTFVWWQWTGTKWLRDVDPMIGWVENQSKKEDKVFFSTFTLSKSYEG